MHPGVSSRRPTQAASSSSKKGGYYCTTVRKSKPVTQPRVCAGVVRSHVSVASTYIPYKKNRWNRLHFQWCRSITLVNPEVDLSCLDVTAAFALHDFFLNFVRPMINMVNCFGSLPDKDFVQWGRQYSVVVRAILLALTRLFLVGLNLLERAFATPWALSTGIFMILITALAVKKYYSLVLVYRKEMAKLVSSSERVFATPVDFSWLFATEDLCSTAED